jgi:hypothetical protein
MPYCVLFAEIRVNPALVTEACRPQGRIIVLFRTYPEIRLALPSGFSVSRALEPMLQSA